MSAPISRPVGIVNFAAALAASLCTVFFVLGVSVVGGIARPGTAFAADCVTAPNSAAPPGSHWYYRTDRTQQRKCWFLRAANPDLAHRSAAASAAPSDKEAVSASANSFASFKEFITQKTGSPPPDRDVEKLYAAFLEWNRRAKN